MYAAGKIRDQRRSHRHRLRLLTNQQALFIVVAHDDHGHAVFFEHCLDTPCGRTYRALHDEGTHIVIVVGVPEPGIPLCQGNETVATVVVDSELFIRMLEDRPAGRFDGQICPPFGEAAAGPGNPISLVKPRFNEVTPLFLTRFGPDDRLRPAHEISLRWSFTRLNGPRSALFTF